MATQVMDLAFGSECWCVVRSDHTVWCWGDDWGIPGDEEEGVKHTVPMQVAGMSGAVAVGVGRNHACALLAEGEMWCWGDTDFGQLGDGSLWSAVPVPVVGFGTAQ